MTPGPRREPDDRQAPEHHAPAHHDSERHGPAHHDPEHHDPEHHDPEHHDPVRHSPAHHDSGRRDPGLQPERTRLAWRRTVLSGTVATVLAVRAALHTAAPDRAPGVLAACALCAAAWLGLLATAHHRMRALTATAPGPLSPRTAAVAVLCTAALAAGAAAVVLV